MKVLKTPLHRNYKLLKKLKKIKGIPSKRMNRILLKWLILPNTMYRFNVIAIRMSMIFFIKIGVDTIEKIVWNYEDLK